MNMPSEKQLQKAAMKIIIEDADTYIANAISNLEDVRLEAKIAMGRLQTKRDELERMLTEEIGENRANTK